MTQVAQVGWPELLPGKLVKRWRLPRECEDALKRIAELLEIPSNGDHKKVINVLLKFATLWPHGKEEQVFFMKREEIHRWDERKFRAQFRNFLEELEVETETAEDVVAELGEEVFEDIAQDEFVQMLEELGYDNPWTSIPLHIPNAEHVDILRLQLAAERSDLSEFLTEMLSRFSAVLQFEQDGYLCGTWDEAANKFSAWVFLRSTAEREGLQRSW